MTSPNLTKLCIKCLNPRKNKVNRKTQVITSLELIELIFMEWKKAPTELVDFKTDKMKNVNGDYKKMFGYPAYFINGNMFAGVHGDKLFLRLSDADSVDIMKNCSEVTSFEPMPGRAMKASLFFQKQFTLITNCLLIGWIDRQHTFHLCQPKEKN